MSRLSEVVDALVDADDPGAPDSAVREEFLDLDRQIRRLEGLRLTKLERLDRRGGALAEHGSTGAWVKALTGVDWRRAHRDVTLARTLADTLPGMRTALTAGAVGVDHARLAASLRRAAGDARLARWDARLTACAEQLDVEAFKRMVASTKHQCVPEAIVNDERTAFDHRECTMATTFGGVGVGSWTLDPVGHDAVATAIHAASRPVAGDNRSATQRRADALVTIARFFNKHGAQDGQVPIHGGDAPQVFVRLPWETLRGAAGSPCATTGLGATISGEAARRIACDARVVRVLSGPMSEILDVGRASRTFPIAARRAIVDRDGHCIWPGCTAPPSWCEAHHVIHWAHGGTSDPENGALLCGAHHDRVHLHRKPIRITADGRRVVELYADATHAGWLIDERPSAAHLSGSLDALGP